MKNSEQLIRYQEFSSAAELSADDRELVETARRATGDAYAPYSKFHVAATARLSDGTIVSGTNQENASYPVGICAERVLLATVATQFKDLPIVSMAVTYKPQGGKSDVPVAPCGMCRQALVEFETRTNTSIKTILAGEEGPVIVLESASSLLPFAFLRDMLKV